MPTTHDREIKVGEESLDQLEARIKKNPMRDRVLSTLKTELAGMVGTPDDPRADLAESIKQANELVPNFRLGKNGKPILNFKVRTSRPDGGYSETIVAGKNDEVDAANQKAWTGEAEGNYPINQEFQAEFKRDVLKQQILELQQSIDYWERTITDMKDNPLKYKPEGGTPNYRQHGERIAKSIELQQALKNELAQLEGAQ